MSGMGRLLTDLARRVAELEARASATAEAHDHGHVYWVHGNDYIAALKGVSINNGATVTTADLRGSYGVPAYARGILLQIEGNISGAGGHLHIDSADETPDDYSLHVHGNAADVVSACLLVKLGVTGSNAGKIKVVADSANWTNVNGWVVGYVI